MTPELDLRAPCRVFIGGEWVTTAEGLTFDSICAANGEVIAVVPDATEPDVDRAMRAAHEAYQSTWADTTAEERYELLMELADRIMEEEERLSMIEVVDSGAALGGDVETAALFLRMYAGFARQLNGKTVNLDPDRLTFTIREPFGVVSHLVPFNRPIRFVAHGVGVALAAGNTVVLKPSEYTPLSALEFAEIARQVLPPGVLNILTGHGSTCGAYMVTHPLVNKVHFRGSVLTGRRVAAICAERSIPYTIELGGKNPFIVYPDADISAAASGAVRALNLGFQGQSCSSATRLFVHEDIYDEFRDLVVKGFEQIRVGLPWDPGADTGAIVSRQQYERVLGYIQSGIEQGAKVLTGGGAVKDPELADGYFIQPTVFETDDPTIKIATEEIFGPVTTLLRWSDEEEVLRLANSVEHGHSGSIWTSDVTRAHRVSRKLDVGVVWINDHLPRPDGMPFGPRKASGVGKEHSIDEIDWYTQEKTVMVNLADDERLVP